MKRFDDWPERLERFIRERDNVPFEWGVNDCALFACDAAMEMTGVDLAASFRGKYRSEFGAARRMARFAGTSYGSALLWLTAEIVSEAHGINEVPPLMAQRGDVVLFQSGHGPALGIVHLDGAHIIAPGPGGLMKVPLKFGMRAWRI